VSEGPRLRWHVYSDPEELLREVLAQIATLAEAAISARGRFDVVLSGGSTPRPLYAAAAELDSRWDCWHVYFADERCLPAGHPERNDTMTRQVWLDHVGIPERQVYAIPAELGPDAAAAAYRQTLEPVATFDLVLLGLGEDGHTASLFPGHEPGAMTGSPTALAVHGAPKPPPGRVSLSAARLADARTVDLLALGAGKRDAVSRLRAGADIPLRRVVPAAGIDVFLDEAADAH